MAQNLRKVIQRKKQKEATVLLAVHHHVHISRHLIPWIDRIQMVTVRAICVRIKTNLYGHLENSPNQAI